MGKRIHTLESSREQFKEKGFLLLEETYINNITPMLAKCSHGHTFKISLANLMKGRGCSECYRFKALRHEEVEEYLFSKGYELVTTYSKANRPIIVICNSGHDWTTTYAKIQSGRQCPHCSGKLIHELDVIEHLATDGYRLLSGYKNSATKIEIQCDKGHIYESTYMQFKSGHRCPKCYASKGERRIEQYLKDNGVTFSQQHRFKECKDTQKLPFDFYLEQYNLIIEYDGEQHYKPIDFAGRGEEWAKMNFEAVKRHDSIKTQFCKENKINLLRIPYWDFKNIETILEKTLRKNFND